MIKAYGYLRVSGTGQVEGDGFDRQRELISRFADQAEIVIPRFYEEKGVSGAKGEEDRPAFQEMLTAILSNGVRAVIVERLDRLAREYVVQEQPWANLRFLIRRRNSFQESAKGISSTSCHSPKKTRSILPVCHLCTKTHLTECLFVRPLKTG